MTLGTLLGSMARHVGYEYDDLLLNAEKVSQFTEYANTAYKAIEQRGAWPWLSVATTIATVATQDFVAMPSDFVALSPNLWPRLTATGQPIRLTTLDELERVRLTATGGGSPWLGAYYYEPAEDSHRLALYPTPTAIENIRLWYLRTLLPMTAITDVPQIPSSMHEALRIGCLAECEEQYHRIPAGSQRAKFAAMVMAEWGRQRPASTQQAVRLQPFDACQRPAGIADESILYSGPPSSP